MTLKEFPNTDLFRLPRPRFALVHCISADLAMAAGIAVQFTKVFPDMKRELKQLPTPQVGSCVYWSGLDRSGTVGHVYNLITKEHCYDKPTYESLRLSLISLRYRTVLNGHLYIGMPKIGCGIDGLDWIKVKPMIEETMGFVVNPVKIAVAIL